MSIFDKIRYMLKMHKIVKTLDGLPQLDRRISTLTPGKPISVFRFKIWLAKNKSSLSSKMIDDAICRAKSRGYLEEISKFDEPHLVVTPDGRFFLRRLKLFNEILKEYGHVWPFVFGGSLATIIFGVWWLIEYGISLLGIGV